MIWNGTPKFNYVPAPRKTTKEKRTYSAEGEDLPSVTTILQATKDREALQKLAAWRQREGEKKADEIRDNAAARGTIMHRILEGYLKGQGHMDLTDLGVEAGTMAQNIIDAGLFRPLEEVYGVEVPLYYPGLYGGTSDVVGIYDNKEAIIDFKQSNGWKKREWIGDYFVQCVAYAMAHNELYKTNIQSGVILISQRNGKVYKYDCFGTEWEHHKMDWLRRVDAYYKQQAPGAIVPNLSKT
jgi:hypothetical protein